MFVRSLARLVGIVDPAEQALTAEGGTLTVHGSLPLARLGPRLQDLKSHEPPITRLVVEGGDGPELIATVRCVLHALGQRITEIRAPEAEGGWLSEVPALLALRKLVMPLVSDAATQRLPTVAPLLDRLDLQGQWSPRAEWASLGLVPGTVMLSDAQFQRMEVAAPGVFLGRGPATHCTVAGEDLTGWAVDRLLSAFDVWLDVGDVVQTADNLGVDLTRPLALRDVCPPRAFDRLMGRLLAGVWGLDVVESGSHLGHGGLAGPALFHVHALRRAVEEGVFGDTALGAAILEAVPELTAALSDVARQHAYLSGRRNAEQSAERIQAGHLTFLDVGWWRRDDGSGHVVAASFWGDRWAVANAGGGTSKQHPPAIKAYRAAQPCTAQTVEVLEHGRELSGPDASTVGPALTRELWEGQLEALVGGQKDAHVSLPSQRAPRCTWVAAENWVLQSLILIAGRCRSERAAVVEALQAYTSATRAYVASAWLDPAASRTPTKDREAIVAELRQRSAGRPKLESLFESPR